MNDLNIGVHHKQQLGWLWRYSMGLSATRVAWSIDRAGAMHLRIDEVVLYELNGQHISTCMMELILM